MSGGDDWSRRFLTQYTTAVLVFVVLAAILGGVLYLAKCFLAQ